MLRPEPRREAELAEELNEPVTDVEPTAEAPAQESGVEPTNPEAAEVVEIKLTTYNLKKAGQAPVSITPESKDIKLESGDQLIRIYKGTMIEVDVLDNGYKWNGEVYPTLTHISWKATGYQIGGNDIFGVPTKRWVYKNRTLYDHIWSSLIADGASLDKFYIETIRNNTS